MAGGSDVQKIYKFKKLKQKTTGKKYAELDMKIYVKIMVEVAEFVTNCTPNMDFDDFAHKLEAISGFFSPQ